MQGLFGLIKQELHKQDKLPMKYYDVPSEPVKSGCIFYVDGINNNGGSHSNTTTKWTPIIGSVKGTKMGSVKWGDKCMIQTSPANGGYYFGTVGNYTNMTIEGVFQTDGFARIACNQDDAGFSFYQATPTEGGRTYPAITQWDTKTGVYVSAYSCGARNRYDNRIVYFCVRSTSSNVSLYTNLNKTWDHVKRSITTKASAAPLALGYNPESNGAIQLPEITDKIGTCNIYAVRIYNRLLTDAEVEANMIYDKNRYGF